MCLGFLALKNPTNAGITGMTISAKTMSVKLFLTHSKLPNRNPAITKTTVHKTPPRALYALKGIRRMWPTPATKGVMVRMMGKKRLRVTAHPPQRSKN